jgi:hypothetical protein
MTQSCERTKRAFEVVSRMRAFVAAFERTKQAQVLGRDAF